MSSRRLARGALAMLALWAAPSFAQELDAVRPAVFAPGALLRVQGRALASVREVHFTALCGDDARTLSRPVLRAAEDELLVVAPAFADGTRAAPASPWGWVGVPGAPPRPAFFLEGTAGRLVSAGAGTQVADGGRLTIAFELAGGEPRPGNRSCTLELLGAPPGAGAFVAVSLPAVRPWTPWRDATLVVDLALPCLLLGPFPVEADGRALAPLPVLAATGLRVAVQWLVAPGGGEVQLSDALLVEL